jgi:ribosomal protein L14E/L6E/L27E
MNEFKVGGFAVATAGHDLGKCYVIFSIEHEYVYLVDGKIRTLDHMKKKKIKHMKMLAETDQTLTEKVVNATIKDEEVKRAIKLLQQKFR